MDTIKHKKHSKSQLVNHFTTFAMEIDETVDGHICYLSSSGIVPSMEKFDRVVKEARESQVSNDRNAMNSFLMHNFERKYEKNRDNNDGKSKGSWTYEVSTLSDSTLL